MCSETSVNYKITYNTVTIAAEHTVQPGPTYASRFNYVDTYS